MPRLDGTGPRGLGPLTGRGLGYCAARLPGLLWNRTGAVVTGAARRFLGFGRGLGYGAGRGQGRGFGFGFRRWGR